MDNEYSGNGPMDADKLREWGRQTIDYVANYWERMRDDYTPLPGIRPGDIKSLLPAEAPETGEPMEAIFADLQKVVIKGNTHWQHPHFFAYFPTANSYPAIMGDIISDGLASIGFSWNSSPSMTELEMVTIDWLAKAVQLPAHFLNSEPGPGAGMIQCTASDCTFVALLCARKRGIEKRNAEPVVTHIAYSLMHLPKLAIDSFNQLFGRTDNNEQQKELDRRYFPGLVAYCSEQAHSSVEKAALLAAVELRKVKTYQNDNYSMRGSALRNAIICDINNGLTPIYVCATVGTTNLCAFDNLIEIGQVCQEFNLWLHIDAAYAGGAMICPEYRHLLNGVEYADSITMNPHKSLLINFDCSAMWFKDKTEVESALLVSPIYLQHDHDQDIADFRNWQIPLGRRFRSLKMWFVMRHFGLQYLRTHIRRYCELAKEFEKILLDDVRFELVHPTTMGLVCFRIKGSNELNEKLNSEINKDLRIHLVPSHVDDTYFLRLAICSTQTTKEDIKFAYEVISEIANKCINE